ncbi:MAG: hypothetical protein KCHDKBKB_02623 [Elusimicrobia bacterium]|nr:hypothetical protein [Elusimicrobiota bacterium]
MVGLTDLQGGSVMEKDKEVAKKEVQTRGALWDSFQEMRGLQRVMSQMFGDVFNGGRRWRDFGFDLEGGKAGWFPAVDIEETDKEYGWLASKS